MTKILSDENFVEESLHLQAVLLDKWRNLSRWRKILSDIIHYFVRQGIPHQSWWV